MCVYGKDMRGHLLAILQSVSLVSDPPLFLTHIQNSSGLNSAQRKKYYSQINKIYPNFFKSRVHTLLDTSKHRPLRILALFYCQIFPQYKGQFVMAMGTESPSSFSTQFMKTSYKCALL